jgi:hypothetical protein
MAAGSHSNNSERRFFMRRGRMSVLLADVVEECRTSKKTGALFVVVNSSEYLARFYFKDGDAYRLSYGPLKGRECLELIDCFDYGKAVFFNGLRIPRAPASELPSTQEIVNILRACGKTVQQSAVRGPDAVVERAAA